MLFRLLAGLLAFSLVFAQAPPSASGSAVIKTTSRIVDVNVIAVDKHGNPVTDLGKEDFVIKESGKERPITLFSLETLDSKPTSEAMASGGFAGDAKTPRQMTFTNHVEQTTTGVTIFLFDGLNTKFEDQARAKAQLVKYLREVDAKDRVALFALGRSLVLLHDFTTDTQAMINAINRHGSRINTEVADAEPIQSNTGDEKMDEFLDNANQQIADYTNMLRATQTAAALEAIAGHVARIPGRKNLVWVSGGFPVAIGFDSPQQGVMRDQRTFNPEIDRAVRALNNSNLAVYPVDARGLRTSSLGAERATPKNITRGGTGQPPSAAIDPNFDSLEALASGTGGRAFHNLNDLAAAIKTATSDARVSYALAFSPPAETLDGRYHPLKVDVKRSGVHIRYRKGYFAYGDTPQPSLAQAIGSQAAFTGVGISVTLKPVENALMAAINVDAHNITLEQKDGKWEGALEFLVLAGKVAEDPKITPFNFKLTPEGYAQVQKEGLILNAKLPAPAGPVQYHVGVKDVASGAIGTLHLVKK